MGLDFQGIHVTCFWDGGGLAFYGPSVLGIHLSGIHAQINLFIFQGWIRT